MKSLVKVLVLPILFCGLAADCAKAQQGTSAADRSTALASQPSALVIQRNFLTIEQSNLGRQLRQVERCIRISRENLVDTQGIVNRVAQTQYDLAWILANQKRFSEAEPLFREVLAVRIAKLGRTHRDVGKTRQALLAVQAAEIRPIQQSIRSELGDVKTLALDRLSALASLLEPEVKEESVRGLLAYQKALYYRLQRDYERAEEWANNKHPFRRLAGYGGPV